MPSPVPTPVTALWEARGREAPAGAASCLKLVGSKCSLCLRTENIDLHPVKSIVSDNSTIWDDLSQQPNSTACLCSPCAWAFRLPDGRKAAYFVRDNEAGETTFLDAITFILTPFGPYTALSVPITARKHTLPYLSWGNVSTDAHRQLLWRHGEAELAQAVWRLRTAGARWVSISQAQPSPINGALTTEQFTDWETIRNWKDSPHLTFATSLMRKAGLAPGEDNEE